MVKKIGFSRKIRSENREECYVCYRAKKNCLCDSIKPFSTRMRFVILMHAKEDRKQKTGTARLAKMCLTNAELLAGTDFTHNERVNSLLRDPSYNPFVLYPGPEAVNFKTLGSNLLPEGKTLLIFVIDGTWVCAKRLLNKSRNIRALPRLSFSRSYISRFAIKKQPREHCVSTIEAIRYLCEEAEEAGYENLNAQSETLMIVFKKLVDTQIRHRRGRRAGAVWGRDRALVVRS
jgi:DTW domain-containing protein YfiP